MAAVLLIAGCGGKTESQSGSAAPVAAVVHDAASPDASLPSADSYDTLAAALTAVIPADARVLGFGELHQRTDRAQIKSTLARFTEDALPALAPKLSDLILETWLIDKGCGKTATQASATIQTTMKRPEATQTDIGDLANAARKAQIQPHAMRVTCDDYARIAPPGKPIDTPAMLDLETRELGRIATEAVLHRDKEPNHRPWIAVYGGALHNDRFPAAGVEGWSYAAKVDEVTQNRYVEIDLIAPELALPDEVLKKQPWFGLVEHASARFQVYKRGERSFVIVLPKAAS